MRQVARQLIGVGEQRLGDGDDRRLAFASPPRDRPSGDDDLATGGRQADDQFRQPVQITLLDHVFKTNLQNGRKKLLRHAFQTPLIGNSF